MLSSYTRPSSSSLITYQKIVPGLGLGLSFLLSFVCVRETRQFSASSLPHPAGRPFGINVKFSLKEGRRQEFLDVLLTNQRRTLSEEPNAFQFCLGEDVDKRNVFYLHEEYLRKDDWSDLHSQSDYFDECTKFFETDPFTTPNVVDEFYLMHDPPPSKLENRPDTFCLNVELCIKPELRDEFLDVIANNKKGSDDDEPLCLQYSWGESATVENRFYFHEQYKGDRKGLEGFEQHCRSPHFKVWEDFTKKDPFVKPPVVQKYIITSPEAAQAEAS
jgi:quinol monooxygenase YgiN